ncbi:MAG: IS1595 family transposase [Acidobacteria bacterium]|nr:IS1595 family transposase [Acidobacteriota bacterium]
MSKISQRQSIPKHLRFTLDDFNSKFPDNEACLEYLKEKRFPDGISFCGKCGQERKHHRVTGRPAWACDYCGSMISPMAGTIFEKSTTALRLWFYAMYLMGSTRCGISAKQIQRETGVTYKTAWRMFRQIRSLLSEGDLQLEGPKPVEMDETYIGGKRRIATRFTMANKTAVAGIVERRGRIIARALPNRKGSALLPMIRKHVVPRSTIYTDEAYAYEGIKVIRTRDGEPANYRHRTIKHGSGVYVRGDIHTNTIEGFWSLVKRGMGGVYHSVGTKYLQSYLDEYCFRYNRRDQGNLIFESILERVFERAP